MANPYEIEIAMEALGEKSSISADRKIAVIIHFLEAGLFKDPYLELYYEHGNAD
jgi:hypothetical protein